MTTCVYDGKFLAADSRSTSGNSTNKPYKCVHCGEEGARVNDECIKIYGDFGSRFYRKETIVAMAGAGSSRDIEKVVDIVRKGEDLDEIYRVMELVREGTPAFSVSFLIVTDQAVYRLKNNPETRKLAVKRFNRDEKVAIGSGLLVAEFSMKALGLNAAQAVMAASVADDGTGGTLYWVDCEQPVGKADTQLKTLMPVGTELIERIRAEVKDSLVPPLAAKKTARKVAAKKA
jgi:hypothetical protein